MNLNQISNAWDGLQSAIGVTDWDDYDQVVAAADRIVESGAADDGGPMESLFVLLTEHIEQLDKARYVIPKASPADVISFLMDQHGLNQGQLPEIGNQSVVSQVLAGKRQLNTRQIVRLCQRFGIAADALIGVNNLTLAG